MAQSSLSKVAKRPKNAIGMAMEDRLAQASLSDIHKKPKTKKEWQDWHRNYAFAFLYGQLYRLVHSAAQRNWIIGHFAKWEHTFRKECAYKATEQRPNKNNLMEDQIDLLAEYVACALCDGTGKENLARISHLLSMQAWDNKRQRRELWFWGGSPIEAYAYIDALDDIDVADVLFISSFDTIQAYREKERLWTQNTAESFLDKLKKDILFDMPNSVINADPQAAAGRRNFEISVETDEADVEMQMLRCFPFREISHARSGHLRR